MGVLERKGKGSKSKARPGEIFEEKTRVFHINGGFAKKKRVIFWLNGRFPKRKRVFFKLNGGCPKRKRVIFAEMGYLRRENS